MPSIVSSGISANAASDQVVVFANMRQEDPAKPRSLAISKPAISSTLVFKAPVFKTDCALDRCGRVLDQSHKTRLAVAFIPTIDEPAFSNRTAPSVGWAEDLDPCYFEPRRNEMMFEPNGRSCYSDFAVISADAFGTDDLIEENLPRKLDYGRDPGG